jgi:hypothetical protein
MTTSSRRAVLAGAVSLSAAIGTGAAVASPAAAETSFPDLVARFIRLRERQNAQIEKDKAHTDFLHARFYEGTGEHWPRVLENPGGPVYWAKAKVFYTIREENPTDSFIVWREIEEELEPLTEEIIKRVPQSFADLACQIEVLFVTEGLDVDDDFVGARVSVPPTFIKNARTFAKTRGFI